MANSKRGECELVLSGENYTLVFDYNAICELEERFGGKSVDELCLSGVMSRTVIREAIRVGLKGRHKSITTPKQVGRILGRALQDGTTLVDLTKAIQIAILVANGEKPEVIERIKAIWETAAEETEEEKAELAEDPTPETTSMAPTTERMVPRIAGTGTGSGG